MKRSIQMTPANRAAGYFMLVGIPVGEFFVLRRGVRLLLAVVDTVGWEVLREVAVGLVWFTIGGYFGWLWILTIKAMFGKKK